MGWPKTLFGRLTTMWSSKNISSESSSSSYPPPVFAVDQTEVATTIATATTVVPELTLRELNKATGTFSAASLIGRGHNHHTAVYRASLPSVVNNDGKATATANAVAKRLHRPPSCPSDAWKASDDEFLRQQALLLSTLRHHNVVRLLGYTIDATAGVRALLFELADMGTLHDVLHGAGGRPSVSWAQRTAVAMDVASGLEYLHDAAAVTHCGISSSKVLLFQGFRAKIGDYDLFIRRPLESEGARLARHMATPEKALYLPPEYVTGTWRSPKFDVYSYGVLVLELLTGRSPKECAATPPALQKLVEWVAPLVIEGRVEGFMDPKLGTEYPPARALKLAKIALCCVRKDPLSRPSMGDVAQLINGHIVSSSDTTVAM